MNKEYLQQVYSNQHQLEKVIKNFASYSDRYKFSSMCSEIQLSETVEKMRKVATQLQLKVALNDKQASIRLLKIYYGLNQLVKSELRAPEQGENA